MLIPASSVSLEYGKEDGVEQRKISGLTDMCKALGPKALIYSSLNDLISSCVMWHISSSGRIHSPRVNMHPRINYVTTERM